ncbi:MAG: PAS domain S-box protein [Proteobacteria bacterium]|nr:PAS domain S-box protein [Pseudomonadota bacterium]MBU1056709.1 PAS domain S-box protein [Pseudomonadota bacterium]
MNGLPMFPANVTDMAGSVLIIVFSFLSFRYAYLLTKKQPDNFLWGFLFYFCMTLAAFAISRAMGHLVKQVLFISGNEEEWKILAPLAGGFNTLLMTSLAAVTFYYHKGIEGFRAIEEKARSLKTANKKLKRTATQLYEINIHLEEMVEDRTRELSASEKKFRNFFTNSKDMVFFCDGENRLVKMNASGLKMLGYPVLNTPPLTLHDMFQNEVDLDNYLEEIRSRHFVQDLEIEFAMADGTVINILLSATAVYDDVGEFIGCEGIAKDLTRLKTMMSQLASSEKMASIGQMAAGVAHEINTPLGVILGYSQLLMDDFPPDTEEGQNLQVIERQTKTCRKIVADLLKFSRQAESAKEDISLNEVMIDVLAVSEHSLSMDHIRVHQDLAADLQSIVGDAGKLRQVFINLINNAHHAMEEQGGGELFISTHNQQDSKKIMATVRDTGHGIPDKVRPNIFDPFFTTKTVGKGTGLGLSVSYGIIQEHGGRIEVESPVVDNTTGETTAGTAFHVILPTALDESQVIKQ